MVALVMVDMPVHPHGCGERDLADCHNVGVGGSSPRMWGTPKKLLDGQSDLRFIPTDVGNAAAQGGLLGGGTVHPHGCGERLYWLAS